MESLRDFSLEVTRWLQENYPQLETYFLLQSGIGRFEFYLAIITLIYWCLDKPLGRSLAYLLTLSDTINSMLKHAFTDPRPYWIESAIGLSGEDSYGIPSGHAQGATVFYGFIAMWFRRAWLWVLVIILILLMALSRVYLGVHDIEDVLAGILVGVLILTGYYLWHRYFANRFANRILGQRLLLSVLVPVVFVAIYILILVLLGQPDDQVPWSKHLDIAERKSFENFATAIGGLLGLGIGFVLEVSRVRFMVRGPVWKRILRYLLGLAVTLLLWLGLDALFPNEPLGLAIPLRILRYMLVSLWVAYYAPWTFVKVRLAESRPDPEVSISI